jgi:sentrin-specific protease 8
MASSKGCANRLLLNFQDAVLYEYDLELLESPIAWLNDNIIHFALKCLQQRHAPAPIHFMDPAVISFLMHQCTDDEDLLEFMEGNATLLQARRILCPINDGHIPSEQWQRCSGTHWSLLIIEQSNGGNVHYYHWTSVKGSNARAAQAVADKLAVIFQNNATPTVVECASPQQVNGYDCGLHVLAAAEFLAPLESLHPNSLLGHNTDLLELRRQLEVEVKERAKEYAQTLK